HFGVAIHHVWRDRGGRGTRGNGIISRSLNPLICACVQLNPLLDKLQPYPFEKLKQLFAGVKSNDAYRAINLRICEPKHPTPTFIQQALADNLNGLANYPTTVGSDALRASIAGWLERRYGLPKLDSATQILPVNGSREALFALAQTIVNPVPGALVMCPN